MLYDIGNEQQAAKTLERLTGVPESYWVIEGIKNSTRFDFADADKDIEHIISMSGGHFPKLEELELIVTHITCSMVCWAKAVLRFCGMWFSVIE